MSCLGRRWGGCAGFTGGSVMGWVIELFKSLQHRPDRLGVRRGRWRSCYLCGSCIAGNF
jgi:hypothetical protein